MDTFKDKLIKWLVEAIDTEIAKPEGEADMAFVDECTELLALLLETKKTSQS